MVDALRLSTLQPHAGLPVFVVFVGWISNAHPPSFTKQKESTHALYLYKS